MEYFLFLIQILMRRAAIELGIPYITTPQGTFATLKAIESMNNNNISINSLREYYEKFK